MGYPIPDKMTARTIIDHLKSGTTPLEAAVYLDTGRDRWYKGMHYYFDNAAEGGDSKVRFIRGRYGDGKTHLMSMARHFALERDFVVSYVSAEHTPLHKLEAVYKRIIRNLQTRETLGGIQTILQAWEARAADKIEQETERLREDPLLDINFRIAVENYSREEDPERKDRILQWLIGEPIKLAEIGIHRHFSPGDSRDMMRSLSVLLRLIGYSGLLVLIDELDRIQFQTDRIRQHCYQVLRELMDNTDGQGGMQSTLFYCAAPSEMFVSDKGFTEYDALRSRLEPATLLAYRRGRVDYRATIIDLESTPLSQSDLLHLASRVRDIHSVALRWDAAQSLPDDELETVVGQILEQEVSISTPRLVATAIATIADIAQQGQSYDTEVEIERVQEIAQQAREHRHRQQYQD